jgi:hypothetical protein
MTKHKITVILMILAIIGLFIPVYNHRQFRKHELAQEAELIAITTKTRASQKDQQVKSQIYSAVYAAVKNQCARDMASYKALAPSVQAKVPEPACNVQ